MPSAETETAEQDSIESYPSEGQPKEPLDHGLDCDCGVTVSLCICPPQHLTWCGFVLDPGRVVFLRWWVWTLVSSLVRLWFDLKYIPGLITTFGLQVQWVR